MKIWLRIYKDYSCLFDTAVAGIEIIFNNTYTAMQQIGLPVCLDDPKERCIELWLGWNFEPKGGNVNILCSTGGSLISSSIPKFTEIDMVFYTTEALKKNIDIDKPTYLWHHHAVDPNIFTVNKYNGYPFIFVHSALGDHKGTSITCEAFKKAFGPSYDVELDIFHPDMPESVEYQNKYEDANIRFCKQWYLRRIGAWRLYIGHCYVYPTLLDPWGSTVCEAMCSGLPVIMSDTSIYRELYNDNCGWWLKMYSGDPDYGFGHPNVDDLASSMRYVYEHQDEVSEKGKYAAQYIREHYTCTGCLEREFLPVMIKYGYL